MAHRQLGREELWAAGRLYDWGRLRGSQLGRGPLGAGSNPEEGDVRELMDSPAEVWPEVKGQPLCGTLEAGGWLGPRELLSMVHMKRQWWLRRRLWGIGGY